MPRERVLRTGVRRFDPYQDIESVAELTAVAFGDRLGPDGEVVLAEWRRMARLKSVWRSLCWLGWDATSITPGFVWIEDGRVVGNVSLRRASHWGGFLIGNVAVHPAWQRRGIASALMQAALEEAITCGGRWVGLDVRVDNAVARRLYERLGFYEVGKPLYMLRPAGMPWIGKQQDDGSIRRGRTSDSAALVDLLHTLVPEPQRAVLELGARQYRPGWSRNWSLLLEGRREVWWVYEKGSAVRGAVRVMETSGPRPDRLEFLLSTGCQDRLVGDLVQQGMTALHRASKKMVDVLLPVPMDSNSGILVESLRQVGFRIVRALAQMRLDLSRRVPIRI